MPLFGVLYFIFFYDSPMFSAKMSSEKTLKFETFDLGGNSALLVFKVRIIFKKQIKELFTVGSDK